MRSIDEAKAAPSDCGGGEQQAIDCCNAVHGRWAELSCLTGMARGGELNSEAIQSARRLHCSAAPRRAAERRSAIGQPTGPATTSNANRSPSPLEECFSERREPPIPTSCIARTLRKIARTLRKSQNPAKGQNRQT